MRTVREILMAASRGEKVSPGLFTDVLTAYTRLENDRDRLEMQLAGCGVAALGWSQGELSAKPGDYAYSVSYGDVVKLRDEFEKLKVALSWYADPAHWKLTSRRPFTPDAEADQGEHARRVLAEIHQ